MEKAPNFEEEFKTMNCPDAEKSISELEAEGWKQFFSFHARIPSQWNMAVEKVEEAKRNGDWEVVMAKGESELEKRDINVVAYLYRRKTEQRTAWDKEHGY